MDNSLLIHQKIHEQFCQALAWGLVYGAIIPDHQWDDMRDKMATQFAETVEKILEDAQ